LMRLTNMYMTTIYIKRKTNIGFHSKTNIGVGLSFIIWIPI
jgi:hypothetical protein